MKKFLIKIDIEREVEAEDESQADEVFWEALNHELDTSNSDLGVFLTEGITIKEINE